MLGGLELKYLVSYILWHISAAQRSLKFQPLLNISSVLQFYGKLGETTSMI